MPELPNQPRITSLPQEKQKEHVHEGPPVTSMSHEQLMELIKAIREPSDEEKEKKAQAVERRKEEVRQSIQLAEQDMSNQMLLHQACTHNNGRYHTFVAQNNGDGNTVAICQICRKDYKWRTTPDQLSQGVNLLEYPGLTEAHLLAWEKQYPPTGSAPDRIKLQTRAGKAAA